MRPARSRTFKCFETAGRLMAKGSASSVTERAPKARRARTARRVGSARADSVMESVSGGIGCGKLIVFNLTVKYNRSAGRVKYFCGAVRRLVVAVGAAEGGRRGRVAPCAAL